jgi:hypothetical protein
MPYLTPEEEEQQRLLDEQGAEPQAPAPTQTQTATATAAPVATTTSAPAPTAQPQAQATMAPPPPPPPPPPNFSGLNPQMEGFASDWLNNPNRYLSDLATATRAEMDARLRQQETQSTRGIEEWAAGRGLVGSQGEGMEGGQMVALQEALQRQRLAEELGLLERLAGAETGDRQAAGNYALDLARFGEGAVQGRIGLDQDQQRIDQQGSQFDRDIALRENMFGAELAQREREFAARLGMDERQFQAQQDQFSEEMRLRYDQLGQQDEQFRLTLEDSQAARAIDTGLRTRAMDLQEQGMSMDEAFRYAQMEQEESLRTRAMDLTEMGMAQDEAYRYAALEQDGSFRDRALDLQEAGMGQDEAYRQAELEWRQQQAEKQNELQRTQIMVGLLDALGRGGGFDPSLLAMIYEMFGLTPPGTGGTGTGTGGTGTGGTGTGTTPKGGPNDYGDPEGPTGPGDDYEYPY